MDIGKTRVDIRGNNTLTVDILAKSGRSMNLYAMVDTIPYSIMAYIHVMLGLSISNGNTLSNSPSCVGVTPLQLL